MPENKCDYPNCQNKVERLFANRKMLFGAMFDKIAVCKEHYDLLLFIDYKAKTVKKSGLQLDINENMIKIEKLEAKMEKTKG